MIYQWALDNPVDTGSHKRRYILNGDYEPVEIRINATTVSDDGDLIVDINDDGTSICNTPPLLGANQSLKRYRTFSSTKLEDGSVITLDVDQIADNIDGVTVELELIET